MTTAIDFGSGSATNGDAARTTAPPAFQNAPLAHLRAMPSPAAESPRTFDETYPVVVPGPCGARPRDVADHNATTSLAVAYADAQSEHVPAPSRAPVRVPPIAAPGYRTQLLQQWEGVVTKVAAGEFEAMLHDLTDRSRPRELATFSLDEVAPGDVRFVTEGSVFYWSIGYEERAGSKRRVSDIRFRRLPAWTASELRAVEREADDLFRFLRDGVD